MDRGYRGGGRGGGGGGGRGGGRGGGGGGGGGRGGYGGGGGGGGGGRGGYGGGGRGGYGGGDGGSRGGRGGGRGGGGFSSGRRAPPSETWNPPNPVSQQKVAPLAKAPANLSFPKPGDVIPMQQPRAPGTLNFAKIQCLTNYYELKLGQKYSAAYFYTVKIAKIEKKKPEGKKGSSQPTGSRGPRKERKLGMKLNRKVFKEIPRRACGDQLLAYDGRSRACGMKRIPNDCLDLIVKFDGDDWQVDLSYEKSVPLATLRMGSDFGRGNDEEESLLALALMMNHMPSISFTPLGRGFYGLPGEDPKQIGGGFDLWTGYKAHVIPGAQKLYFNVNYAITAFIRPGKLIELLPELTNVDMNATTLHPRNIKDLKMKLSRCRCETLHMENRQKKFTITSITNLEASKIMFTDRDGARVSVAQYFKIKYKALRYPNWPCVQVGTENPKYLPLEVVKILEGNPFRGEQTPQLVSDIIKCAAIPPRNRLEEIRATVGMLRKQNELDREFDLQIGEELVVPARILPPPRLVCAQNKAVAVRNPGVIDFRADRFYRGSSIKKWTVIITDERCQQNGVNIFVDVFIKQGAASGVQLAPPMRIAGNQFHVISDRTDIDKAEEAIQNFVGRNGLEFVLFVIADSSPIHAAIKFVCDVKLGVSSKCVKSGTINKVVNNSRPGPDQCILNILYGLNPKFDGENVVGINTEFAHNMLMTTPTLILGFDVNHGQAKVRDGLAKMPSTVGVVGTRNFNGTLYNAYMRAQRKPATSADREVIQDEILKPALKKIIIGFYEVTKRKPERIIVYRDGVSNGQFGAVLQKELRAIVEVCQSLPGQYRPPITFVTVQKRHDSRLFPKQVTLDRNGREKQNPIAGTVVDEVMTGSKVWNFYIVAHEGIQGTSKPAHCNVLYDENNFSNDQLQSLTYYMCHLYGKCPRAVSLPSPVYYAHHVAFRGAELGAFRYFKSQAGADATSYSSGSNGNRQLEEEELKIMQIYNAAAEVKHEYAGSMYFL